MNERKLIAIYDSLCLTSVFFKVTEKPLFQAFEAYIKATGEDKKKAYAAFVAKIYEGGGSLTELCKKILFEDENVYVRACAAKREISKNIQEAAKRELMEETGAIAASYVFLGQLDTSPALIDEKIYMYLAEDLSFGERKLDDDEFVDVKLIPLKELLDMVMQGDIKDAKTQICILKAAKMRPEYC